MNEGTSNDDTPQDKENAAKWRLILEGYLERERKLLRIGFGLIISYLVVAVLMLILASTVDSMFMLPAVMVFGFAALVALGLLVGLLPQIMFWKRKLSELPE